MDTAALLNRLRNSDRKLIAKETGIPYDRMAKWLSEKKPALPKKQDFDILIEYFKAGTSSINRIPFYDVDAVAGNDYNMDMQPVNSPVGSIDVGDFLRDSECAIRIYGNSMMPNYPSGCVVGLRQSKDGIVDYGNVYVIETEDNRYFKRIFKDNDGKGYTCYSDNTKTFTEGPRMGHPCYEPFVIPFKKVKRLFRVVGMIKRNENSNIFGS